MRNAERRRAVSPARRWFWISLSLALLAAVIVVVLETEDKADVAVATTPPPVPVVTVIEVAPKNAVATISAFAELRPRWDVEIRAAVSGRIAEVHNAALAGERVETGAHLFSIEKHESQTAVASAELNLEEARLSLWRAKNAVTLARKEFERSGAEPPNELALRLPELRIAEHAVMSAEAQLKAARRQLADTDVLAPFSGFIVERKASLGQTVSAGDPLIHLSDDSHYELTVEVNEADWAMLDSPITGKMADLFHRNGAPIGQARIRRGGGFLDPETRQRRLFLDVEDPGEAMLAGDFVKVAFTGRSVSNTLTIPESALSRAGHVWTVDTDDLLVRIKPKILFRSDDTVTIAAPEVSGPQRIAITPLASLLPGQRVTPQPIDG